MKPVRTGLLIALALTSALVVIASPAFATPRLTSSTGLTGERPDNGAVSPFLEPIGSSVTSNFTANLTAGTTLNFTAVGGAILRCRSSIVRGWVDPTHTQAKIYSISFGNGAAGNCDVTAASLSGTLSSSGTTPDSIDSSINCQVSTVSLGVAHLTGFDPRTRIARGTLSRFTCSLTLTIPGFFSCSFTVFPQSIDFTYLASTRVLTVNDATVGYTAAAGTANCPPSGNASLISTFTLTPQTRTDLLTVTNFSSIVR